MLDRARAAGVVAMVVVGTDLASSREAVGLAEAHGDVFATVGLHPHDASRLADEWDALADLAAHPRVVAVGEAGFDYHYMHSDDRRAGRVRSGPRSASPTRSTRRW